MCGFGQQAYAKEKFMDKELFEKILTCVGPYADCIRLNGRGESTIHPNFIEMVSRTRELLPESRINLFTNLSLKNDLILQSIIQNRLNLFISIDSPDRELLEQIRSGCCYDTIVENLGQLRSIENRPFIVCTLQDQNIHHIVDLAQSALHHNCHILYNVVRRDQGIESFQSIVRDNISAITRDFLKVMELYRDHPLQCIIPDQLSGIPLPLNHVTQTYGMKSDCPALMNELCIIFNGDITPCNMFNPYVYGNIIENSLEDIMSGDLRLDFINNHGSHYYCRNCACLGGT